MSGPVYDGDAHLAERLDAALADTSLRDTLSAARETTMAGHAGVLLRHPDWRERVARARAVRKDAIARCAELCDRFEERFSAQGGRVVRAATLDDARAAVVGIARERGVTLAVKGKSMVSEELELNEALAEAGVTPVETDLGEWVAQLAGERPSHLLAPIVHRSRRQVADVLEREAGHALDDDPAELVAFARGRLRTAFLEAGIGITGCNFLVAETGTAIVIENEGNGRLVTSLPRTHVVLVGIEKVVERAADAAFLVEQTCLAAIGREISSYVSWISGPARDGDDGPAEVIAVIVDGGRSALLGSDAEDLLTCVRCGACVSVCPVYRQVGGHAYGSVYSGPIGAVLSPRLTGMREDGGRELPFLSTLCGACTDACPVGIPLHDQLVRGRVVANAAGEASLAARTAWRAWALAWSSPGRYRASARAGALAGPLSRAFGPGATWARERAALPSPARKPFHARWRDLEREAP